MERMTFCMALSGDVAALCVAAADTIDAPREACKLQNAGLASFLRNCARHLVCPVPCSAASRDI